MSKKLSLILLLSLFIITAYWWAIIVLSIFLDEKFVKIHFLNIGQGDSILIETKKRNKVVIDAGRGVQILQALEKVTSIYNNKIDVVVITHPDSDHIGGFIPIFDKYDVQNVFMTYIGSNTNIFRNLSKAVIEENSKIHKVDSYSTFYQDEVLFEILWPLSKNISNKNNSSIIILISYGKSKILLTGDADKNTENKVIDLYGKKLKNIQLLKAGHHGSKTSTGEKILNHTTPEIIVYSAGENNIYGHPHQSVVNRVKERMIENYETKNGTVSFCLTKEEIFEC